MGGKPQGPVLMAGFIRASGSDSRGFYKRRRISVLALSLFGLFRAIFRMPNPECLRVVQRRACSHGGAQGLCVMGGCTTG